MMNPLLRLRDLGQSIWLDYIRRDLFDGELERLIEEDGLAGMTSNPTIFQQAIGDSDLYDDVIRDCGREMDAGAVFERVAVADIQRAADHFRPLYDRTSGRDGFVSIEASPALAYDTDATLEEVRQLWRSCDRPNVMVKIPGTHEGLSAIRQALAEGINVNITLLFAVPRYREVMEAWLSALEERVQRGASVERLASVASFFVSRVDSKVDKQLKALTADASPETRAAIERIEGRTGIANARIAYHAFEEVQGGARFAALADTGARVQRPLWASTSTKNPELPDVYYVEALIGPETVNTLPPDTLEAYRDHGEPAVRIHQDLEAAREAMETLASLGIDFATVTRELEEEGVKKFADSYDALMKTIAEEQRAVASTRG